jgi:hypothetical protein
MADNYFDDDKQAADLLEGVISPLSAKGMDPDEAVVNRDAALARIVGNAQPQVNVGGQPTPASQPPTPVQPPANDGVPGAVTPSGSPQKTWKDYANKALQGQLDATGAAADDLKKWQSLPDPNEAIAPLEEQRSKAAQYIDPMQKQYRPSVGQRILRGVQATLTGGLPGAVTANYGAPNKQYGRDVQKQNQTVGGLDQQISVARKNYEDASNRLKALAQEQGKVATGYKDVASGAGEMQKDETTAAKNANETPEAKAKEKGLVTKEEYEQRSKILQSDPTMAKQPGGAKAYYLATGRLPDPRQATAEEVMFGKSLQAWERDPANKGKVPTVDDMNKIVAASKGNVGKGAGGNNVPAGTRVRIESDKDNAIAKAKKDFQDGISDFNQYIDTWQQAQNRYENEISAATNSDVPHVDIASNVDAQGNWKGPQPASPVAPATQPTPAAPKAAPKGGKPAHGVGDVVSVKGQKVRITGIGKDGKYQGVPAE